MIPSRWPSGEPFFYRNGSTVIGLPSPHALRSGLCPGVRIGEHLSMGRYSVIYSNVSIGNHFTCGNSVLIREDTVIGDHVTIRDHCSIGAGVSLADKTVVEQYVHIPSSATIGTGVMIGPDVQFLRDPASSAKKQDIILEDRCIISGRVILHPGVCVGEGAKVAEGTAVTSHVPPHTCAYGNPMKCRPLEDPQNMPQRSFTDRHGQNSQIFSITTLKHKNQHIEIC